MHTPRHIVTVAAFIRDESNRVLMILSPKRGWEIPGGQVEEGESLPDALRREVQEETGLDICIDQLAGVYTNLRRSMVLFAFTGRAIGGTVRTSEESHEVVWLDVDEGLRRITNDAIRLRFNDLCSFEGRIIYRTYLTDPFTPVTETLLS